MENAKIKMKSRNTAVVIGIAVVVVVFGAFWLLSSTGVSKASPAVVALAQCLAEKKVTMYGAEWCPHCQREKARFGDAFTYVPYVECPENPNECVAKGINGYPTWVLPSGEKLEGEQGLEKLARESGCPYSL